MNAIRHTLSTQVGMKQFLRRAVRRLGSLKIAVVLLAALAAVIAAATIVEADYGRAYAQWYVYHSGWFVCLLALLGVNISCAAISRWPWKRRQFGFVVTHGGLLVLLAGSITTFVGGVEGQVTLTEGQSTTTMSVPQYSQVSAFWADRPDEPPYEFTFIPGPVSWRDGTTLDVGTVDGVKVRILQYFNHAQVVESWVADKSGIGGPVVRVKCNGPDGSAFEQTLVDQDYGDEALAGPVRLQLQRATADAMLDHFFKPPTDGLGQKGVLLAYFEGRAESIPVDDSVGKKVRVGETGVEIEVVQYLANARPDAHGRFEAAGEEPKNPLLELKVHLPAGQEPFRQVAFAKSPLLSMDAVYGRACPVKFRYIHPAAGPSPAVELMQAGNGKLFARFAAGKELKSYGEVTVGGRMELPDSYAVSVLDYLPHARQVISFEPVSVEVGQKDAPEAAAEIEIVAEGLTHRLWLQRNNADYGQRTVVTPQGVLRVGFGTAKTSLDFGIKLVKFQRGTNPGGVGNATFSSLVRLVDPLHGLDEEREISMNEPLTHNGLTFYQSGFNDSGHGPESSTFSVARDPGRGLKYCGSLMICCGIAVMFYMRAYIFKNVPRLRQTSVNTAQPADFPQPLRAGPDLVARR
jgi:hypothetical protein